MSEWLRALTDHMEHISSNSCDPCLYSRSLQSGLYLCWGSLVLLQRCSAPPPLFPGREQSGFKINHDLCSLQLQVLVGALTSTIFVVDFRLSMEEFRFFFEGKQTVRCHVAIRFNEEKIKWGLTTCGKMIVSMSAWICFSFMASFSSSFLTASLG